MASLGCVAPRSETQLARGELALDSFPSPTITGVCWMGRVPEDAARQTRALVFWDPTIDDESACLVALANLRREHGWLEAVAIAAGKEFEPVIRANARWGTEPGIAVGLEDYAGLHERWLRLTRGAELPVAFLIEPFDGVVWAGKPSDLLEACAGLQAVR